MYLRKHYYKEFLKFKVIYPDLIVIITIMVYELIKKYN